MRWKIALYLSFAVAAMALVLGVRDVVVAHRRAADVLRRFADVSLSAAPPVEIEERPLSIDPSIRARLYLPRTAVDAPGLVLVHGIHRLGIDEPRLVRFARALASSGIVVCTPEIRELADYRVDARSIDSIGAAAEALSAEVSERAASAFPRRVGVMGMSFAGGLSLLAARDPRFAPVIAAVVAVGAHDDAARVARFFATSRITRVDGVSAPASVHPYGALVFVYAHAEGFFEAEDVASARAVLSRWLSEDRDEARKMASALRPASKALIAHLFDGELSAIAPEMLRVIGDDATALAGVSPHGRLSDLSTPVYLLHGAGDSVIPPSETAWLAEDIPRKRLRARLISRALVHVEPGGHATWYEQWELLHFMAQVLTELDGTRH